MNNRQLFQSYIAQTSPTPQDLEIVKSAGCYLSDINGKKYLDLISGIGVSIVGHRHPHVLQALSDQMDKYLHTMVWGEHILSPQVKLASLIKSTLPESFDNFYFLNSGTEAVELALKLARRHTGRYRIISSTHAYHGSSSGSAALMSPTFFTGRFRPLVPDVAHIRFNDLAMLDLIDERCAAVVIEVVQAESGIFQVDKEYLQQLKYRCVETGTLLIFDEIQSGLGRTGTWWAFERYGILPDILLSGKGLGGGLPLSMVAANKSIMRDISNDPVLGHITTYGGNPLCCAAGIATIETIIEEKCIAEVIRKEKLIHSCLVSPRIVKVRTVGLWAAVELAAVTEMHTVMKSLMSAGIITDWFLFNEHCLRIAPPLNIDDNLLSQALETINQVINGI